MTHGDKCQLAAINGMTHVDTCKLAPINGMTHVNTYKLAPINGMTHVDKCKLAPINDMTQVKQVLIIEPALSGLMTPQVVTLQLQQLMIDLSWQCRATITGAV